MSSPTAAGVPEPTTRSWLVSSVGGAPTGTGTSGAPGGRVSSKATHGWPATEARAGAVEVVEVEVVVVAAVLVELPLRLNATRRPTTAMAPTTLRLMSVRRRRRR